MQAPTVAHWPPHYTSTDIDTVAEIQKWMAERQYTQAALARLARISGSSLNQIIKGVYPTSPTKLLHALRSAMRHADETSGHAIAPVETSVFKLMHLGCDMARRYRNFAVLTAYVAPARPSA